MHRRLFGKPFLLHTLGAPPLERVVFHARSIREGWFQDPLRKNPMLIPVDKIEDGFGPLMPDVLDVPKEAGPVDVVYIDQRGYPTLAPSLEGAK